MSSSSSKPIPSSGNSTLDADGEFGRIRHINAATVADTLPSQWEYTCDFEVDYGSEENASMVHAALAVDKELQPDKVKRRMTVSDGKLVIHFEAVEARFLRASFSAFVDILTLATKTIEEFGPRQE